MENSKEKLILFLSAISIGKYSPKLYHRGQAYSSTWLSGILTIVLLTLVSIGSISVLSQTFSWEAFSLTETMQDLEHLPIVNETYWTFLKRGFRFPSVSTYSDTHKYQNVTCQQLKVTVFLNDDPNNELGRPIVSDVGMSEIAYKNYSLCLFDMCTNGIHSQIIESIKEN